MSERNTVLFENAKIIFPNFSGAPTPFNPEGGDRTFNVLIEDQVMADQLKADGWNVKILNPIDPEDPPRFMLPVKIAYNYRRPNIVMVTNQGMVPLTEETVGQLDAVDIDTCDIEVRPYDWSNHTGHGRKAYLQSMYVNIIVDPFLAKYQQRFAEM